MIIIYLFSNRASVKQVSCIVVTEKCVSLAIKITAYGANVKKDILENHAVSKEPMH